MARIRSIKPEFWTSEQIAECSPNARLVFIGMWSFCDDSGIHPSSTKRLKMEIFPADNFSDAEVKQMVGELIGARLLTEYVVSGVSYWRVTGWKHQKIDQPTYKHPLPDGSIPKTPDKRRIDAECSPNTRRTNGNGTPPEGRGGDVEVDVESNGRGGGQNSRPPSRSTQSDFDERDLRKIGEAKKKLNAWLQKKNDAGADSPMTNGEYYGQIAEESGVTVKRILELEKTQKQWPASVAQ